MGEFFKAWPATKRAGKACLNCRVRKVKCNVEEHGIPCTNCLTDEVACRVLKSRRGRKPSKASKIISSNDPKWNAPSDPKELNAEDPTRPLLQKLLPVTHTTGWLPQYDSNGEDTLPTGIDRTHPGAVGVYVRSYLDFLDPRTDNVEVEPCLLHRELTYASLIDPESMHCVLTSSCPVSCDDHTSTEQEETPSIQSIDAGLESLPECVKPISQHLTTDDIHYLRIKGALDVPTIEFRKGLIESYIQFFHPFMPLLDLPTLMNCASDSPSDGIPKMSILLLQAVMFTGVTFVDIKQIQKAGFSCRRTARRVFYDKARLLYDLDAEHDRLSIIQAATLMSFWNETPGDSKGGWHWMGIAVSLALTLGLHRLPQHTSSSSTRESRLRKRVWWSCYMRDRLLSLLMCRVLRIKDAEFITPMLTLDDFELDDFDFAAAAAADQQGGDCLDNDSVALGKAAQTRLAETCIHLARLCTHIEPVMQLHFSLFPPDDNHLAIRDQRGETSTMLFPRNRSGKAELVSAYDVKLQKWLETRPPSSIYHAPSANNDLLVGGPGKKSFVVSQAFSHMIFCGVVSALHRPEIHAGHLSKNNEKEGHIAEHQRLSMTRVEQASLEIAAIDRDLPRLDLDGCLLPSVITLQLPIVITHMKRLQTQDTGRIAGALEALFSCIQVLERMQQTYVGADAVMTFVLDVMRKGKIAPVMDADKKLRELHFREYTFSPGCFQVRSRTRPLGPSDDGRQSLNTGQADLVALTQGKPLIFAEARLPSPNHTSQAQEDMEGPDKQNTVGGGDADGHLSPEQWAVPDHMFLSEDLDLDLDLEQAFGMFMDHDPLYYPTAFWSHLDGPDGNGGTTAITG